ncbi:hydrophobin [Aspergillus flavus AF70]|nr:hydrophobin [Aspergillus flavus AF70]
MKVSTLLTTLCVLGVASSADPTSQCDNGPVQCCATVGLPTDSAVSPLLGLLGVVVPDMSTQVGLTCNPIVQGGSCPGHPVCCTGNNFNGLLALGCTPVTLST